MVLHLPLRLPDEIYYAARVGPLRCWWRVDDCRWRFVRLVRRGFFGLCLLVAVFEPWLPKPDVSCGYGLLITQEEVACEYLKRKRESIRWEDVNRIWYVTTSAGPWLPDEWLVFEGETGGCSFPTEAMGMDGLWDELKQRFAGFDSKP